MEDMDEEEEDLLEDRTAKLEEQQELLDEIQRNKQRANGYLDDDLVNRSVLRVPHNQIRNFFSSPLQRERQMVTDTLSIARTITLCPIIVGHSIYCSLGISFEFGILSSNIYKRLK